MFGLPSLAIGLRPLDLLGGVPPVAGLLADLSVPPNPLLSWAIILTLCVVAGVGTVLLLPGRRDRSLGMIGGVLLLAAMLVLGALLVRYTAGQGGAAVHVYFWIFSFVALAAAVRVITHPRPVYSALYFVLTVFATAGLFILLWAEFMAAALVLIYAGAILITYCFVIMLAQQAVTAGATDKPATATTEYDAVSREPLVASAVGFALMGMLLFVILDKGAALPPPVETIDPLTNQRIVGTTQDLGRHLFQSHLVNLELAGLLLTVSMIGAIVIARKRVLTTVHPAPMAKDVQVAPATPVDDDPHSIPVYGTENPRQKAYPET